MTFTIIEDPNAKKRIKKAITYKDLDDEDFFVKHMNVYTEAQLVLNSPVTKAMDGLFALTMGLGKTVLMATCIFYEFLLANKYPKDKRFCHNALVFAPDKTVLESLREIQTFNKALLYLI